MNTTWIVTNRQSSAGAMQPCVIIKRMLKNVTPLPSVVSVITGISITEVPVCAVFTALVLTTRALKDNRLKRGLTTDHVKFGDAKIIKLNSSAIWLIHAYRSAAKK